MNCHGNNKEKHSTGNNPMKHMLHMVICCGMPLLIISLLPFISRISPRLSVGLAGIAPFICPLMMLFMIPMMFRGAKKGSCCAGNEKEDSETI